MLNVFSADVPAPGSPFVFTVPGHQTWTLLSVCAVLARGVGGIPNRGLQLEITNGLLTVTLTPATDIGTEPGTETVTWTNCAPSEVSAGHVSVTNGVLPQVVCPAGYQIVGSVVNGVAGDAWTSAVAWVDYIYN